MEVNMGKLLDEMDMTFARLAPVIEEKFDMVPDKDGKYTVTFGEKSVCKLEIVSKETNLKESFENARRMPEEYTVFMTEVKDYTMATDYIELLDSYGFESVSVAEESKSEEKLIQEE
jgi:hypothetical protein